MEVGKSLSDHIKIGQNYANDGFLPACPVIKEKARGGRKRGAPPTLHWSPPAVMA